MTLVSPSEMQDAAVEMMLGGRQPETGEDWMRCVNFWAANIQTGLEVSACRLMALMFDVPLEEWQVTDIARFQAVKKTARRN